MGMTGDNLKDYVYHPSEETIVSYLRRLESHGREVTNLPSTIKWMQVYSSEVMEATDFKESWMEDFQVGAHGDRHAKWYATDLIYNSKGKGATRGTPRGGNWNLRSASPFDDYNRKILIPLKEIEKINCKVAFLKKKLHYRKGKEVTPWKMTEYTIGEVRAQYAICQIFPVQPIEPSQDDVPLAALAAEATSHAASVPRSGPHLQEPQCTAAQDETARRSPDNVPNNAGPSPNQNINFPGYHEETCRATTLGAPTNRQPSSCRDGQSQLSPMAMLDLSVNSSVKRHRLQQEVPELGMDASSNPSQDMNHQRASNVGNCAPTNRQPSSCRDGQSQLSPMAMLDWSVNSSVKGHRLQLEVPELGMDASSNSSQDMNHHRASNVGNFTSGMNDRLVPEAAQNIECWTGSPVFPGYCHSPQGPTFRKSPDCLIPPMQVRDESGSQRRSKGEEIGSNSSQDPHLATKNDAEKENTGPDKRGEMPAVESHTNDEVQQEKAAAAAAETEGGDRMLEKELEAFRVLSLMTKKNRREEEESSSEGPCYGEEVKKKYPLFFYFIPQKPHYQGLLLDGFSEGRRGTVCKELWYSWVDLMEKALQTDFLSTSTHGDIEEMKQQAISLEKLGFDVRHVKAWLERRTPSISDLNDARDRLHSTKRRKRDMEKSGA